MLASLGSRVHRYSIVVLLLSLVVAALFSLGGRLLVANIDNFRTNIEDELSAMGISGVSLQRISGHWHGLKPVLRITGASLSVPHRDHDLHIDELELSVDVLSSLLERHLKIGEIRARVTQLVLIRDGDGRWWLNDIELAKSHSDDAEPDFYALLQQFPDYVSIDIGMIRIRDAGADVDHVIRHSEVRSHVGPDGLLNVILTARLPDSLGGLSEARFYGNRHNQSLYVTTSNLNPAGILSLAGYPQKYLREARVSLQSWIKLANFRLQQVDTRVSHAQFSFINGDQHSASLRLEMDQRIIRDGDDWSIDSQIGRTQLAGGELPPMVISAELDAGWNRLNLAVDRFEPAAVLLFMSDLLEDRELAETLMQMEPSLSIENLAARIDLENPVVSAFEFSFKDLKALAYQDFPGIDSLSGRLIASQGQIRMELPDQPLKVSFTEMFRQPILVDRFSANLNASLEGANPVLAVDDIRLENEDLSAEGRAWFEFADGQMPFMMMRLDYREGRAKSTGKYLPVTIMPDDTVEWLDRAIKGGTISTGGLLYHGRLNLFSELERDQSGVFHAAFEVIDPDVEFLPGWPHAQQGRVWAGFRNLSMNIEAEDVQLADAEIETVEVSIENMLNPLLRIQGSDRSDSATLLNTLAKLPAVGVVDEVLRMSPGLGGEVDTSLDVQLPLDTEDEPPVTLQARAILHDVQISLPDWMIDFSEVNGVVVIDNEQVSATGLKALYLGERVLVDVSPESKTARTNLRVRGKLPTRSLLQQLPRSLRQPVSGKSHWDIKVSVANDAPGNKQDVAIKAHSSLLGTTIDAPYPVDVAKDDGRGFTLDGWIDVDNSLTFVAHLPARIKASGMLRNSASGTWALDYLDLNFAEQEYSLKDNGVNLTGVIDHLDLGQWSNFLNDASDENLDAGEVLHLIKSIDLRVDELRWLGRDITGFVLKLGHRGDRLAGTVDSSLAKGSFELPLQMGPESPLSADLEYLRLRKPKGQEPKKQPDMRLQDMPNLRISSRQFSYEDMKFDGLVLNTRSEANRFVVNQLDIVRGDVELASSGQWQYSPDIERHVTVFNVKVQGSEFGKVVSELGLGDSMRKGTVDFEGQIGWGGSLFDINWPSLIGEVRLNLKDGYLNNVEPGAGRFVGLLSLNALPKRLFLDFGDVLNEGMQFDEISGDFTIKGELMTTENATMNGSSAKVVMVGDTNLRHQTYDQRMLIIPKIGETLPVLGTLAAGSSVGWALLLIQKIFEGPIEKSVEIEYQVSGSWDEPELTLIPRPEISQGQDTESDLLNDN